MYKKLKEKRVLIAIHSVLIYGICQFEDGIGVAATTVASAELDGCTV